ncbi:MAG: hypothetical protein ACFFBD_07290 [Candidatus Hodarchaeota archaeon]
MSSVESTIELIGPPGSRLVFLLEQFREVFAEPVGWIHTYPLPVPYLLQVLRENIHHIQTIQAYDQTHYRKILEQLISHESPFKTVICEDFPTVYRSHPFMVAIKQWVQDYQHQVIVLASKSLNMFERTIQVDKGGRSL